MHLRYLNVAVMIAAGLTIACSDTAVDRLTAPQIAATPATPVLNEWPTEEEYVAAEIPAAIGLSIEVTTRYEDNYRFFVADARVRFNWVNDVSATLKASLINQSGNVINSGTAAMAYRRQLLPVASGDTTFTVKISTNNITCGLIGKAESSGAAAQRAINTNFLVVSLWEQTSGPNSAPDNPQPACDEEQPPPEEPPATGGGGPTEVCYDVWREYWIYDPRTRQREFLGEIYLGRFCYFENET